MAGKSKVYEKFIVRKEVNGNLNIRFIINNQPGEISYYLLKRRSGVK